MTTVPEQRPVERGKEPRPGDPEPEPDTAGPEPDAVYDPAEAALVAERLEALGYIE